MDKSSHTITLPRVEYDQILADNKRLSERNEELETKLEDSYDGVIQINVWKDTPWFMRWEKPVTINLVKGITELEIFANKYFPLYEKSSKFETISSDMHKILSLASNNSFGQRGKSLNRISEIAKGVING